MQTTQLAEVGKAMPLLSGIRVSDVTERLGSEVFGIDVTDDKAVIASWDLIKKLLRDRYVVVFRNQDIDAGGLERFAMRFGELERSLAARANGVAAAPIHTVDNLGKDGKPSKSPYTNSNYFWHSDRSNYPNGSAMVMLAGQELPPSGGDTQFANMVAAYEALSQKDKDLVATLKAVHSFEYKRLTVEKRPITEAELKVMPPPSAHPLARTNPETGRRNLYLGMYVSEIVGMPHEEGRALIKRLQDHATQPELLYTHKWRKGDFVIWDNLSLMHRALSNYEMDAYRRVMMRCGVQSQIPIA